MNGELVRLYQRWKLFAQQTDLSPGQREYWNNMAFRAKLLAEGVL